MLITPISCVLKISLLEMVRYFLPSNRSCTSPSCRLVDGCQLWPTQGWEFIKEKKKVNKKVNTYASTQKRTRSRKHALVHANMHSYKKASTQKRNRARKHARKHALSKKASTKKRTRSRRNGQESNQKINKKNKQFALVVKFLSIKFNFNVDHFN